MRKREMMSSLKQQVLIAAVFSVCGILAQKNEITETGISACPASTVACLSEDDNVAVFPVDGSSSEPVYYIGGIFPVHTPGMDAFTCATTDTEGFQEMMAFQWAVSTAQRRLSTNVSSVRLGAMVFDTCGVNYQATQSVFGLEKCKNKAGMISGNNVTLPTKAVDRTQVLGYISSIDGRNGQMINEASRMVVGLQKPLINAGTYPETFASYRPGSRNNFVTPTISQQMEATADVITQATTAKDIYAAVVYSANEFSMEAFKELKKFAENKNICVIYEDMLSETASDIVIEAVAQNLLINKDARFVVNLLPASTFRRLHRAILERTNHILNFTFIFPPFLESVGSVLLESSQVSYGAVQIRHAMVNAENFKAYYRNIRPERFPSVPLVSDFWQTRFQCNLVGYTGNNALRYRNFCSTSGLSLQNDAVTERVGYIIQAVDALLVSIKRVQTEECSNNEFCAAMTSDKYDRVIPQVTLQDIKVFNSLTGGPNSWTFDVFNLQIDKGYEKVGSYKNGGYENIGNISAYILHTNSGIEEYLEIKPMTDCPPGKCFFCRPLPPSTTTVPKPMETVPSDMWRILPAGLASHRMSPDAVATGIYFNQPRLKNDSSSRLVYSKNRSIWSVALAVLAGLGILAVIIVEGYLIFLLKTYKFVGPDGVKTSHFNYRVLWLGQLLLFGIFLSYLTLFAYLPVPTAATCGITRFGIGISYAIMFSCLLVKLIIILSTRASERFIAGEIRTPFYQRVVAMVALFLAAFSIQLIIDIQWLIQVPPQAVLVRDNGGKLAWVCNHYTWPLRHGFWNMQLFVRTEFDNHLLSLVYIMFLILVTFFLSLKAFDSVINMRESRFITLAVGISILIFIPWAMIGGLTYDHVDAHEIGDGCIGFGLFFTATVILFAMFLPKVRQLATIGLEGVFLEDDKETTYASSVYSPPSGLPQYGHRSMVSGYGDGSVIGMQTLDRSLHLPPEDLTAPQIINVDTSFVSNDHSIHNPHALRLVHPKTPGPSLYSVQSTPNLYDPPDLYQRRAATLNRNLTGRSYTNESFVGSEYPSLYRPKSETLLYKSARSDIGSL